MTTIVALKTGSGIIMGADSRLMIDGKKTDCGDGKLVKIVNGHDNTMVGIAGDGTWINILGFHSWDIVSKSMRENIMEAADAHGALRNQNGAYELAMAFECLIAEGKYLWYMDTSLCPVLVLSDYWAIGSGANFAMGALHSNEDAPGINPRMRVSDALAAAAAFDPNTGGKFHLKETKA